MKRYFWYECKRNAFLFCFLALAALLVCMIPVSGADSYFLTETSLVPVTVVGCVYAVVLPVIMFSYKTGKRSVDLYGSLPLTHTKIFTVKFLVGLLLVLLPYLLAYWLGAAAIVLRLQGMNLPSVELHPVYFLSHCAVGLIWNAVLYAFYAFAYTRGNRLEDGILSMIFWSCFFALIVMILHLIAEGSISWSRNDKLFPDSYFPFSFIDYFTAISQRSLVNDGDMSYYSSVRTANYLIGGGVILAAAVFGTVWMFVRERSVKAENAQQISESPFLYPVMLPFYSMGLSYILGFGYGGAADALTNVWFYLVLAIEAILFYLLTAYWRRSLRIGKWRAIVLVGCILAGLLLSWLSQL